MIVHVGSLFVDQSPIYHLQSTLHRLLAGIIVETAQGTLCGIHQRRFFKPFHQPLTTPSRTSHARLIVAFEGPLLLYIANTSAYV